MSKEREQINGKTFYMLDNENIEKIEIRTIGLLDVFGKIEIDIMYKNKTKKELVGISPIDRQQIVQWLEDNKLYDKAIMYQF